jgi:hypothetical protein
MKQKQLKREKKKKLSLNVLRFSDTIPKSDTLISYLLHENHSLDECLFYLFTFFFK